MAVTDWDQLTSITRERILPGISDTISKASPALTRFLGKAKKQTGGKTIDKVVRYAVDPQGGGYAGLEVLDAAQVTTRTRASWTWRQMYQPIVVSNIDIAKNGGPEKVLDLVAEAMDDAKASLQDKYGTTLFGDGTGDSSKRFLGLIAAVDDSTNIDTYGGIVRSTYTWWKSSYTASAGAIAASTLATTWDAISVNGKKPTVHLTTPSLWTAYEQLLHPQARFNFQANGYPKVDGGFDALSFRGRDVLADEYCTSGYWYMLHEDTISFLYLPHPDYSTDSRGFAQTPLERPTSQDGKVGYILSYCNLINENPRYSGVIRGLS